MIQQERRGDYLGKTVQMVPHCTDLVQSWIREVAQISVDGSGLPPEVCLVEVLNKSLFWYFELLVIGFLCRLEELLETLNL